MKAILYRDNCYFAVDESKKVGLDIKNDQTFNVIINSVGDIWINKELYSSRVQVGCRGGEWRRNQYFLSVDGVYIHPKGFRYLRWQDKYELESLDLSQTVALLNKIENIGPDNVLMEYRSLVQSELDRLLPYKNYYLPIANASDEERDDWMSSLRCFLDKVMMLSDQITKIDANSWLKK